MTEVAQHPSTPPGNTQTADAAIPPQNPATINRKDYRAPAWLVPDIALDFALGLETTRVRSTLTVEKNPAGDGSATLRLDGDGLAVTSLTLDGRNFNSWAMDGDDLLIDLPGDKHTIEIETRIHHFDHEWTLPSRIDDNPLIWMLNVNGFMMDVRRAPREVQQVAFEKKLIPYIPADRP